MFRGKPWVLNPKEKGSYHLEIEQPIWSKGGTSNNPPRKLSLSHVVTFDAGAFRQFLEFKDGLGYELVQVMHDPSPEITERIYKELEDKAQKQKESQERARRK